MACESSSFNILGNDVSKDKIILKALGRSDKVSGMSNLFESHGAFSNQSLLSQAPKGEGHFTNLIEQPSGLLDLVRFGCVVLGRPLVEMSFLDFLQGVNMPGGDNWDASEGLYSNAGSSDVTDRRLQLLDYFPMITGFGEVPFAGGMDLEKKPKGREGSVVLSEKTFLPTVACCQGSGEDDEYSTPLTERKLHLSLLQEEGYRILTERDRCEDPIYFGLTAAGNQPPSNPCSQFSVAMDIVNKHFCTLGEGDCSKMEGNLSPFDGQYSMVGNFEDLVQECYECQLGYQNESFIFGSLHTPSIRVHSIVGSFDGGGGLDKGSQNSKLDEGLKFSWFHEVLVGEEHRKENISNHVDVDSYPHPADARGFSAGAAPEGLIFVLRYLKLQELLAMEQVSKPLRDSVRNDTSLWTSIRIEQPLSKKVRDDVLVMLSARAQGHLQSLCLPKCARITDAGVQQVLATNPMISKLSLPGCVGISAEAVVKMVEAHMKGKSLGGTGLKQLRIHGLAGVTSEHVEKLQTMLYDGGHFKPEGVKPQYYHYGKNSDLCDNDRLLDVEACPICGNARIVYDCTRERCQQKHQQCRGCTFCITRCEACGVCIDESEYEETFCLDLLCSSCWLRPPKCLQCDRPEGGPHAEHFAGGPDTFFICSDCQGFSSEQTSPKFYVP